MNRHVKVDGKVRTDMNFPTGQMDVVSINKVGRLFRLLYSTKGHFVLHKIPQSEGNIKLCKVMKCSRGSKGSQGRNPLKIKEGGIKSLVPYLTTNDGRTIRYPDPLIQVNDTIVYNFETGKILDFAKFEIGNLVMVTKGSNIGRIGTLINIENHPGSFNIAHVKDSVGHTFATRYVFNIIYIYYYIESYYIINFLHRTSNIFVIGKDQKPQISQPKEGGIAMTAIENREKILMNREKLRDTDDAVEI